MKAGKLDATALAENVFPFTGSRRQEVVLRAALGEDSAVLDIGEGWQFVLSSDPITGAVADSGWLAVHVSCNDIVSNGAEPLAIMLTILLPEDAEEAEVKKIMESADKAARELGIEIIGGHTEITYGLKQVILSTTAIGKVKKGELITSSGGKIGDDIVLTKGAGIEGTGIIVGDFADYWQDKLAKEDFSIAREMLKKISVVSEGKIAASLKASSMHDVTEGGVLGALFEVAQAAGKGIEIYQDKIPVAEVTKKICGLLDIDPLKLISSGSLLITIKDGENLVKELAKSGIKAAVIGKVIAEEKKKLVAANGALEIEKPQSDELWKAIKRLKTN